MSGTKLQRKLSKKSYKLNIIRKKRIKEYYKTYYKKHKEKLIAYGNKYRKDKPLPNLLRLAKQRALQHCIPFDIMESDLVVPKVCPFLGCILTSDQGVGRKWSNISVDRIDSTKGYIKGNVWIISDLANRMKQNATPEELIMFARGIRRIYGE